VAVRVEVVVNGLEVPWGIGFLPGGDLLVTERPGRIRLVRDGELVAEPVASPVVDPAGEGGLLGLALHPEFESNRLFYIYLTGAGDGQEGNRIERWRLSADNQSAQRERVIIDNIPAARFHNGGRIRFGPDGMLYVGTGDARQPDLAQQEESLAGKILRLTPDGGIPEDNPFSGQAAYMIGLRNTQGFDWRDDGTMLIVDHGPSGEFGWYGADEINVGTAGTNFGWPEIHLCEDAPGMRPPSLTFERALPPAGAALYTGDAIDAWEGSLIIGTLGSRHLHRVVFEENSRVVESHSVYFQGDSPEGYGRLREVVMGPDGHLYVTTSNCDGRGTCPPEKDMILRIVGGQ
jgi:glucose/arabinose dehydrogenase